MSNAPQMPGPAVNEWWEDEHAMLRHTGDLLAAELSALRPGRPLPRPLPWHAGLQLQQDLGADSLELMQLSSALAMALSPQDGGALQQLHALPTVGQWAAAARDSLRRQSGKFGFATSGSTGRARYCYHDAPLLWQEVAALARLLPGRRRILCAVPAHHVYGFLFSILLPRALGLSGVPVVDLRASAPAALAGQLRSGDLVVAHPLYWSGVSDSGAALPGNVLGVSSGAPCPARVAQALRALGLATLMEVYGSSETAGVGWRTQEDAPYRCFPWWRAATDAAGGLLRTLPDGALRHYPAQDRLEWLGDDSFRPMGRVDHAVQVGGVNVFPAHVASVLTRHPGVRAACVRLMRPDEGTRLKAFVVPADASADRPALAALLDAWSREVLSAAERPVSLTLGESLPVGSNGKPRDWMISD